jgi:hypothetical protein
MTTTVLSAIADEVNASFISNWENQVNDWGERVQLYRDYIDGKHRLEMTKEVADLLMIEKEEGERFVVNYCKLIMQKPADRLKVINIKALPVTTSDDADDATKDTAIKNAETVTRWGDRFRKHVRFDGKQIDNHEMVIGDGDNFVMIDSFPLSEAGGSQEFPAMVIEPAYNGLTGIVPIYDLTQQFMIAVAKIWESGNQTIRKSEGETSSNDIIIDEFRVNIYYPDRVEKFETQDGTLKPFVTAEVDANGEINNTHVIPWVDPVTKKPLGIPFVHFKNDSRSGKWNGESRIKSAIPANDILNRSTMNMVLMTNLTAAMIRYIIGADTPGGAVTPGMWVKIGPADGISKENHMPQVGTFEIGSIQPVIEESNFAIEQLSSATDTPLAATMASSNTSAEYLKELNVSFTAYIEKTQTKLGNNWEDVMDIAYRVQKALGTIKPPDAGFEGWETVWKPAEIRNDAEIISNANLIADRIDNRTYLETVAPAQGWDARRIEDILERLREQTERESGTQPPPGITPNSFANTLTNNALSPLALAAAGTEGLGNQ